MIRLYNAMKTISLMTVVFLSITSLCLAGSFPPYIHYQGRLADQETGAPFNGKKDITFSFYLLESGGDPVYYQTKQTDVHNGLFSAYIGQGEGYYNGNMIPDGIPARVFTEDTALYLGIRVGDSTTEMSPRHLIGSVAYAYHAEKSKEAEHLKGQVTVSPSGNVGIDAADPSGLLDVGEGLFVVKESGYAGIGTTNPSGLLDVNEGGLVVKESGNTGIGTKSPGARLHVTTDAGDGQAFIRASNFNPIPTAYWPGFDETAPYLLRNALWVGWDDSKKAWKYIRESDNDRGVTDPGDPATWVVNGEDTGYFDGELDTLSPGAHMNNRYNSRMMAYRCNQDDIQVKVGNFWIDKYPCRIIDVDSDYTGTTWKDDTSDMATSANTDVSPFWMAFSQRDRASTGMTWFVAAQACVNAGKRMVDNAEWQAAALGTARSSGNDITNGSEWSSVMDQDVSRYGVVGMAGNVWEWVADWIQAGRTWQSSDGQNVAPWPSDKGYGDDRIWNINGRADNGSSWSNGAPAPPLRGGYWRSGSNAGVFALAANRAPSHWSGDFGFRSVR